MARKPWARAVELVTSSQESEDQLAEDHVSVSDSESQALTSAFWLPLVKRHTADLVVVHRREPINVVSSCTGSCAEGAVLKESKCYIFKQKHHQFLEVLRARGLCFERCFLRS